MRSLAARFPLSSSQSGFSLAELLVSLLILAEIATFTIPKILTTQQNGRYNAAAKEVAAMLSGAYMSYQLSGNDASTMRAGDLVPYLNYTKLDLTSQVDGVNGESAWDCGVGTRTCYHLHNGGVLYYWAQDGFCNGTPTAVSYTFDPEAGYSGVTTGSGRAVRFYIYLNGRLTTEANLDANTQWNSTTTGTTCSKTRSAIPTSDPSWFRWN